MDCTTDEQICASFQVRVRSTIVIVLTWDICVVGFIYNVSESIICKDGGKWFVHSAFLLYLSTLSTLYSMPRSPVHTCFFHTFTLQWENNVVFSILPKNSLTCRLEQLGNKPNLPISKLVDALPPELQPGGRTIFGQHIVLCFELVFQVTSGATALFPPGSALNKPGSVLVRRRTHYCLC